MNEKIALLTRLLKKLLLWLILPLVLLIAVFLLGEQFEVGRLSAIASCEGSMNNAACIRSKGYLANSPYYPDLTRRYFASYARMIGGDLGASYRVEPQLPALNLNKTADGNSEEDPEDAEDQKASPTKEKLPPAKK
jgi:ABC-type dipeptide/oligopeptide/nickel transport system permease component